MSLKYVPEDLSRIKAIATLEVDRSHLVSRPDTEARLYAVTDAEYAMRHVDAIPEGSYAVFRDASGRVYLQKRGSQVRLSASTRFRSR